LTPFFSDGLTVVTGVSGSGKSSLVFDTLHREASNRFSEAFSTIASPREPVKVKGIDGLGPVVFLGQNILNQNSNSTLATTLPT
jgi:excinuclease ABC subunit A